MGNMWEGQQNADAMIGFARSLIDKVKSVESIDDDRTEMLMKMVDRTEQRLGLDNSEIEADADESSEVNNLLSQGQNLISQVERMQLATQNTLASRKGESDRFAADLQSTKSEQKDIKNGAVEAHVCIGTTLAVAFLSVMRTMP
jgi:hypothetical protein